VCNLMTLRRQEKSSRRMFNGKLDVMRFKSPLQDHYNKGKLAVRGIWALQKWNRFGWMRKLAI
jgi:hypothetical protein